MLAARCLREKHMQAARGNPTSVDRVVPDNLPDSAVAPGAKCEIDATWWGLLYSLTRNRFRDAYHDSSDTQPKRRPGRRGDAPLARTRRDRPQPLPLCQRRSGEGADTLRRQRRAQ
ncbi:hypothetical protein ACCAA_310058 [Candidatus Accumulibacter aalborgensis]|uniref:Uncharacterized protein n=1 Tax=Candidatus Accumulibacter aalborgensis TaxID=1860102 RepID=A0A1A8XMC3_9PROT|nr:hypothetical protein ACCAA_310058 [Candidatus Accumulibacter aalborgensis]